MTRIENQIKTLKSAIEENFTLINLKNIYNCIDLTNLNSYAKSSDIQQLCDKAVCTQYNNTAIETVAAVCVYPSYISLCKKLIGEKPVKVATVTACFPHAQSFPEVKYLETEMAIQHGADEIDIVLNLASFLNGFASESFDEIKTIKQICGNQHLKVILETSFLKEENLIREASDMALEAGADFIKTSTGKDGSEASPEAAYIMCEAILEYHKKTGKKAGLKPAGGISTSEDAVLYYSIVNEVLGDSWITNKTFRIGASRLATNLLNDIVTF